MSRIDLNIYKKMIVVPSNTYNNMEQACDILTPHNVPPKKRTVSKTENTPSTPRKRNKITITTVNQGTQTDEVVCWPLICPPHEPIAAQYIVLPYSFVTIPLAAAPFLFHQALALARAPVPALALAPAPVPAPAPAPAPLPSHGTGIAAVYEDDDISDALSST
jgi:hypothetical protein